MDDRVGSGKDPRERRVRADHDTAAFAADAVRHRPFGGGAEAKRKDIMTTQGEVSAGEVTEKPGTADHHHAHGLRLPLPC